MATTEKFVNLFDLKEWSTLNDGLGLITKLQQYGALPTQQKCIRGHMMNLVRDQTKSDNFKWICREKMGGKKGKKLCNYR